MKKMDGLDSSRISVISAKKVDKKKLIEVGDSDAQESTGKQLEIRKQFAGVKDEKCNLCCAIFGGAMTMCLSLCVCAAKTSWFLYCDTRLKNYSFYSVLRHVGWISAPSILCGASLHYFMSEAMWSSRRNTWGMAWVKACAINTFVWTFAIAVGTLGWRKGIRYSPWSKLYYKYPIPTEPLELRLIQNPNLFWAGMGWTYWSLGILIGQIGYMACAGFTVSQNRIHFMMSPVGPYAKKCLPRWRREQIARAANFELSPTQ